MEQPQLTMIEPVEASLKDVARRVNIFYNECIALGLPPMVALALTQQLMARLLQP